MSAVVLPVRLRAPEHWQQHPMFDPDELWRMLGEAAEINRQTARLLHVSVRKHVRPKVVDEPRPWRPNDERLQTYARFRATFVETAEKLAVGLRSKTNVCGQVGCSVKTLNRCMTRLYHLKLTHWPPSTWPEKEPTG